MPRQRNCQKLRVRDVAKRESFNKAFSMASKALNFIACHKILADNFSPIF
jgi:hypothetical protein